MLDVMTQIMALLTNAPDLEAAIGKSYGIEPAEVWNLPDDVALPNLAVSLQRKSTGMAAFDNAPGLYVLNLWFEADTSLECYEFEKALFAKLNNQQFALTSSGQLKVDEIKCNASSIGKPPATLHFQLYTTYSIVA